LPTVASKRGVVFETPLFLPVYQHGNEFISTNELAGGFGVRGLITNAFFLYRDRALRARALELGVHALIGFDGLVVTDSGAFQGFTRPLLLDNRVIVRFQDGISADVVAPLDLVTSPGEPRSVASKKLDATLRRIEQAMEIAPDATVAGVQQGGRFLDLRERSVTALAAMGCRYVALGSLVPFFTKGHDLSFARAVIQQARGILGETVPVHLFGAGDPVELPFYSLWGCDVFDSSSYIHYARDGWYMTRVGAFPSGGLPAEIACKCPHCDAMGSEAVHQDVRALAQHNLWTILSVLRRTAELHRSGELPSYVEDLAEEHGRWFPESRLPATWR